MTYTCHINAYQAICLDNHPFYITTPFFNPYRGTIGDAIITAEEKEKKRKAIIKYYNEKSHSKLGV